jgi:hypothetical protein
MCSTLPAYLERVRVPVHHVRVGLWLILEDDFALQSWG